MKCTKKKLFSWNRTIIFSYLENLKPVLLLSVSGVLFHKNLSYILNDYTFIFKLFSSIECPPPPSTSLSEDS